MASRYYIDVTLDFVNKQVTSFERITFKNKITRFQRGILIGLNAISNDSLPFREY
ncbi:MAG: hypothetical protein QXL27_07795 [Candidatus Bathyarchaeia archaeon]